ncbi:VAN3-binding protein-like [Arachis duranensis]|uniref:VAN3-binding protein-like n=1 Tax=Arachis duranensis TaxID=130453 RepID=A0A9C6WFW7_ARADU|nr:VAN3-binding protein-like [Arachis duranensis]
MRNYITREVRNVSEQEDAKEFGKYLLRMKEKNQNFFFEFELEEDQSIKLAFWADARSRAAFVYFGDVISFDTTYNTNKYNLAGDAEKVKMKSRHVAGTITKKKKIVVLDICTDLPAWPGRQEGEEERRNKNSQCSTACYHLRAAVASAVAAIPAAMAASSTPSKDERMAKTSVAVASTATLVVVQCVEATEAIGAERDHLASVVSSAVNVSS